MKSRVFAASVAMFVNVSLAMSTMAQEASQRSAPPPSNGASTSAAPPSTAADQPVPSSDQADDSSDAPRETHNKNKNDIDDIGSRNIGNRGLGDWYSLDTDIKMGKQYAMMVEQNAKLIQDPVITEYVNRIGQNLVRNSDAKVPFTIKVIDSDEINAFALPGGFFYVNSGLILAADEEA